jgi:succinate dehydrogenase/fumarate reductase flavoprotein subunit
MWDKVGLVRDGDGLRAAVDEIDRIADALQQVAVPGGAAFNVAWQDWLDLVNQVEVSRLIALSGLARRESRGAHYRSDHPATAPGVPIAVRVQRVGDDPSITTTPVAFTRATPEPGVRAPVLADTGD